MASVSDLFEHNRLWAARTLERDPASSGGSSASRRRATSGSAAPTAACRPTRSSDLLPGRAVRPSQRRQRRRPHRSQLPLGAPVRGGRAEGRARDRLRPLRLRRRSRPRSTSDRARAHRQLAPARAGHPPEQCRSLSARHHRRAGDAQLAELNVLDPGRQRVPDDDRDGRVAPRAAALGARLDLRPARRTPARPRSDGDATAALSAEHARAVGSLGRPGEPVRA